MNRVEIRVSKFSTISSCRGPPTIEKRGGLRGGGPFASVFGPSQNDDEMIEFHPYMGLLAHSRVSVVYAARNKKLSLAQGGGLKLLTTLTPFHCRGLIGRGNHLLSPSGGIGLGKSECMQMTDLHKGRASFL